MQDSPGQKPTRKRKRHGEHKPCGARARGRLRECVPQAAFGPCDRVPHGDDRMGKPARVAEGKIVLKLNAEVDEVLGADEMFAAGLAEAKGSYCALLEPDIMLAPEALFEVVRRINERRVLEDEAPARVLYAHHDVLDANGMLCELACKPLYSPDLLLSYNYAGPLIFFERELLDQLYESAGFVREALVYDLLLKAIETTGSIERIDQILYHLSLIHI